MLSPSQCCALLLLAAVCHGKSIQEIEDTENCKLTDGGKLVCKGYRSDVLYMPQVLEGTDYEDQVRAVVVKNGRTPTIVRGAFANIKSVTQLSIHNMAVSTIDANAFEGLSQIKLLDLSHNNIRFFHASTFKTINVRHLKLDGNPFLEVPTNSPLLTAPKLQWLSLRQCGIRHLPGVAFQGTPHLAHLDLSYNRLSLLPQVIFENTSLTGLDLSHNQFRTISLEVFRPIPSFPLQPRTAVLADNPWHCDCSLMELMRWLSADVETHYPTADPARSRLKVPTICASPASLAASSWHNFDEFACAV